jgi:hypothetical protein
MQGSKAVVKYKTSTPEIVGLLREAYVQHTCGNLEARPEKTAGYESGSCSQSGEPVSTKEGGGLPDVIQNPDVPHFM